VSGEVQDTVWPLPKFYFSVDLGDGQTASFQEVTGLDSETKPVDYREGSGREYPVKVPGLQHVGRVTLRKGIFANDARFSAWYSSIKLNTPARRKVAIHLLDENGAPKMTWTLHNAYPAKITGTDLKSEGNEVAVEAVEIAYETLVVSGG
jgi:phage tail-like protein